MVHVPRDKGHQDDVGIVVGQSVFSVKFICLITGYVCDHKLTRHVDECCKTNLHSLTVTSCTWVHCSIVWEQLCDLEDEPLRLAFLIRQGHDMSHSKHTSSSDELLCSRAVDQTLLHETVW